MDRKKLTKKGGITIFVISVIGVFIGSFVFLGKWELSEHLSVSDRYWTAFCITVVVLAVLYTLGSIVTALFVDRKNKG